MTVPSLPPFLLMLLLLLLPMLPTDYRRANGKTKRAMCMKSGNLCSFVERKASSAPPNKPLSCIQIYWKAQLLQLPGDHHPSGRATSLLFARDSQPLLTPPLISLQRVYSHSQLACKYSSTSPLLAPRPAA
ncbi:hypothetical protein GQ54DRAFT_35412 [Martensiomyces pterosporus]|nr:hypothetical protein GQ54DRAFT_35412 [Martensiomyces pterosporus]